MSVTRLVTRSGGVGIPLRRLQRLRLLLAGVSSLVRGTLPAWIPSRLKAPNVLTLALCSGFRRGIWCMSEDARTHAVRGADVRIVSHPLDLEAEPGELIGEVRRLAPDDAGTGLAYIPPMRSVASVSGGGCKEG